MPLYRVTLQSERPISGGIKFGMNPFRIHGLPFRKVRYAERVWEFDAVDEADVVRLYREAKKQDLDNVRGFELARIEVVPHRSDDTQ